MAELDLSPRRIWGHRERLGLSRRVLAARLGLSHDWIKRIEYGSRLPSLPALFELCRIFGVMPNDLLRQFTDDDREYDEGMYWHPQEPSDDQPRRHDWAAIDDVMFI